ncbi:hypothetical protein OG883_32975 [Streptomyces sp. NBC_01142]|uniref:hypothetical protein n=1 Tax=Streptomyces sp. NBC_01142 TaxID=2975865 RepID=UPI00225412E5|nr:hypothetical protein [Streptomyces sp. NBC_01142]MCX4824589.1 hypothetical protein [Streptomyces sp. NBC_01142]
MRRPVGGHNGPLLVVDTKGAGSAEGPARRTAEGARLVTRSPEATDAPPAELVRS